MRNTTIFSFLIHPNKGAETPVVPIGSAISGTEKIGAILSRLSEDAERECDISIIFSIGDDGEKSNTMHDLLVQFCSDPTIGNGESIAYKLGMCTTKTSGQCLLFLIHKSDPEGNVILVLSRFPAEFGILAESLDKKLQLEYVEQVFMKSHNRYKAVIYKGKPVSNGLWVGKATDKQITYGAEELANYWIYEFLESTYKDSSAHGTMRFAVALKQAVNSSDNFATKTELVTIALQMPSYNNESTSIEKLIEKSHLSEYAKNLIIKSLSNPQTSKIEFIFSTEEFFKHVRYTSIELDNGGILFAPLDKFNKVFNLSKLDNVNKPSEVLVTTQGKIVNRQLRKGL